MDEFQLTIVGAGPAGVATAVALRDRGIKPLLLERAPHVGASWRTRYDRLKLNTGRQFSHLPGRSYPKGTPTFPTRDQLIEHFASHARQAAVLLQFGTTVNRIDKRAGGWQLHTPNGDIGTRHVVVATGLMHTPSVPRWAG